MRNLGNKYNSSNWGEKVRKTFERVGDREGLEVLRNENGKEAMERKLKERIRTKRPGMVE